MKIAIEKTDELTQMDGVAVRRWNGVTESGVECDVFVHRLRVKTGQEAEFERELKEEPAPVSGPYAPQTQP